MSMKIIDGNSIAAKIRQDLKERIEKSGQKPGLAIVQVGNNPASAVYINRKMLAGNDVGINMRHISLPEDIDMIGLLQQIDQLNSDKNVHGIIVQLPIPGFLDSNLVLDAILPHKDVDGFHPLNVGNLAIGKPMFIPATAKGVLKLIDSTGEKLEGKHAVIVGRSNIVGKPVSYLLLNANCTVTVCHKSTRDLVVMTKQADILVAAVGRQNTILGNMIKPGAIVIDVGINKADDGSIVGDVEFESAKDVAGWITKVPGGVGPMTVAMLLENTYEAMIRNPPG